ncbi:MAG TPA: hypothetical protein VE960_00015 [bacterium]|nr:hypothetical protein [bacterium]
MPLSRFVSLAGVCLIVLVLVSCSSDSPTKPDDGTIEVDLSKFPNTGQQVPNRTVMADQWASLGILFDALPEWVDPIVEYFGGEQAHIFFAPDTAGAVAVFSFVEVGSRTPTDISAFEIEPWFSPGESAELIGLDEGGAEVAMDTVTADDIGDVSTGILMSIEGTFRTVEWRTHGNPGIAAGYIAFEF